MPQPLWREPQVEEAPRNLILQNRCGNRLTLLCHERHLDLDLSYKPNAFRRKDLAARTFSGRDVWTNLFRSVRIPDVGHGDVVEWGYDPFVTQLGLSFASGARNCLQVFNLPDENVFALSARAPVTLVFAPHQAFTDWGDGLFVEARHDRGEDFITFVRYPSRVLSRLRDLPDGSRALQLLEDDVVLIGAEENRAQVERVCADLAGLGSGELIARIERALAQPLAAGRVVAADPDLQRVLDLNRRIAWSGLDAGGACFGAINRIYHLVWVRDGSMTSAHLAQAGNAAFVRTWAPFLLANPGRPLGEDGQRRPEFGQIVGTRWSKGEDDGLFYAVWTAFSHWQATGDDTLLQGEGLTTLVAAIEHHLATRLDPGRGLMGSDTLGEESLHGSPYFGYDVVNGSLARIHGHAGERKPIRRCRSLYHQLNTINVLLMAGVLLAERPALDDGRSARWSALAQALTTRVGEHFAQADGTLLAMELEFTDGTVEAVPFGPGSDYWETAWAVSQGPFLPLPAQQLATARSIVHDWPRHHAYGFCPWNCLARSLHEYGVLPAGGWRTLLDQEVREALLTTTKYPMPGALTEYQGQVESWRGLPFSAGSLLASACAQLLQAQPQGVAVRGGSAVQEVTGWRWRLSRIDAAASGDGERVAEWTLDGERFTRCLVVPLDRLRAARHRIVITRTATAPAAPRLVGTDAQLIAYAEHGDGCRAVLRSAVPMRVRLDGPSPRTLRITAADGQQIQAAITILPDGLGMVIELPAGEAVIDLA